MPQNNYIPPTVDEIIALLKRSNLPTLIVEGKDDLIVYKRLEETFYDESLSVLPVGGRRNILNIFDRLHEIPQYCKVMFIADQDTWVITGIPPKYQSDKLFFTSGYSIENDVFQDGRIYSYMSDLEKQKFGVDLNQFLAWYSIALSRTITGRDESIKLHPNNVLDDRNQYQLLTKLGEGEEFPQQYFDELTNNYMSLLRGKSLMQLAMRQLSYNGRPARHSDKAFIEHVAISPGPLINKLIEKVETGLK